ADVRRAAGRGGFPEVTEPEVEVLFPHLLELEMRGNRAPAVGAVLQDHRTPEVGHLLEMRLPVSPDLRRKDRTEALIRPDPSVEIADKRADKSPVHHRVGKGHFLQGGNSV